MGLTKCNYLMLDDLLICTSLEVVILLRVMQSIRPNDGQMCDPIADGSIYSYTCWCWRLKILTAKGLSEVRITKIGNIFRFSQARIFIQQRSIIKKVLVTHRAPPHIHCRVEFIYKNGKISSLIVVPSGPLWHLNRRVGWQ